MRLQHHTLWSFQNDTKFCVLVISLATTPFDMYIVYVCSYCLPLSTSISSGTIPSELGGLTALQNLDLSYNHLSGESLVRVLSIPNLRLKEENAYLFRPPLITLQLGSHRISRRSFEIYAPAFCRPRLRLPQAGSRQS